MKKKMLSIIIAAMLTASVFTACDTPAQTESQSNSYAAQSEDTASISDDGDLSSLIADLTNGDDSDAPNAEESESSAVSGSKKSSDSSESSFFTERDLSGDYDESEAVKITCSDSTFKVEGEGASVKDNVLTISSEGVYIISGTIKDGRIVVDADDSDKVQLVLNGCSITSSDYSAIYVRSADKVFITLADGTTNAISDGKTYASDSEESTVDSAIFSKSDLVINGTGKLNVNGNMSHAIVSKDDLKITGGTITVESVGSAICGKESVRIANADITITSGGDGIKSTNNEDDSKGYVYIESGKITVTADNDAVQAETTLVVLSAEITGTTGGGASNSSKSHEEDFGGWGRWGSNTTTTSSDEDSSSAKGLKAGGDLAINGAKITLDSADDTLHAGGDLIINSGTLTLSTGDDGIHADGAVAINDGSVTVSESYEGIEGMSITINGGDINVKASDDGMNASDGNSEGGMPGMGGMMGDTTSSDVFLLIAGGTVHVNADGDGLDSNNVLTVSGGTIYVDGPTNSGNGALDSGSGAVITGGTIIAVGSSGMAESFGTSSSQASIIYNLSESHSAGETITLKDSSGNVLMSYKAEKTFNSVVISTPEIKSSGTYTLTVGSSEYTIEMSSVSYSNGGGMGGMGGMQGGMGGMQGGMGGRGMR